MKFFNEFIKRIIILLILYSISRIYLFYNNFDSFYPVKILEFLEGIRFDLSAIIYINIPLFLLLLSPLNFKTKKKYKALINIIFYITNIPFLILNNIDIEYYKFTQKRSTSDFIQLIQLGTDFNNLIPIYLKKFWPTAIFTLIQIWIILKIKEIPNIKPLNNFKNISNSFIVFLFSASLLVVGARGGIQLKPINPINAGELSNSKNSNLILNTPFCLLQSINKNELEKLYYYDQNKKNSYYDNLIEKTSGNLMRKNIVILIMESYSKEFIGFYNESGFTPFLDSLMKHSLVFTNAYANGVKSIDALPAIISSIPPLMNDPFITSNYGQNKFNSIPSLLKNENYSTSFFHGGTRGTMGFYSYSKKAGYENYYGKEEFNNERFSDGVWGIYDKPFFEFFHQKLNKQNEPFFSTFFSLSSHLPFTLPKEYLEKNKIKKKIGIRETILYTDQAMSNFFHLAKKEPWFKNTLFIITADHTSPYSYNKKYKNKVGRYAIPLIIFSGDSLMQGTNNKIVQQIDIMPSILEIINFNKKYFTFGKSMINGSDWAVCYRSGKYQLISNNGILINSDEKYQQFSDWQLNNEKEVNAYDKNILKAIKQTYNNSMIDNKMNYEN
jgi:phosphoglycerol transferase MdoB-like AlkP superfamily enzyme